MHLDSNRSPLYPWLCNECKDKNDTPSGVDWVLITKCSTNDFGQHHSHDDQPSQVLKSGTEIWHKNGVVHRDGGKVALKCFCIHCTESHAWLEDGEFHRFDGPALILIGQDQEFYSLRGVTFNSKEEYEKNLSCKRCRRDGLEVYCTVNKDGQHHSYNDYPSKIIKLDNKESLRWHQDGILHRIGGAAVIFKVDGMILLERYYLESQDIGKTKYLVELQNYQRKTIMNRLQRTITQSLRNTNTLQAAVKAIVSVFLTAGAPFSSGEVARYIRLERQDIVFAVPQIGTILRDMYINFELKYCVGHVKFEASRVERFTDNNTMVYVYGPTEFTAVHHDFKVIVPPPVRVKRTFQSTLQNVGQSMQNLSTAISYTAKPAKMPFPIGVSATPTQRSTVPFISPAISAQSQRRIVPRQQTNTNFTLLNEKAKVHSRERLAIPSTALENLRSASANGWLRPGSIVSFVVHNGTLKIVAGYRAGWEQKAIQKNKGNCGRLYFTSANLYCNLTYKDSKTIHFDKQEKELRIVL